MADKLMPIGSLWIGGALSWLEIASIRSFVDLGHDYILYAYDEIPNVPEGARLRDAREIWDTDSIQVYSNQSPALHADIFRVMMVAQTGRAWVDTDIIALRPFPKNLKWYIGHERTDRVELGNAVLCAPKSSLMLQELHEFLSEPFPVPPWLGGGQRQTLLDRKSQGEPARIGDMPWGTFGPKALTWFARKTGEIENAQPAEIFFPVSFQDRKALVETELTDTLAEKFERHESLCVHLYSRWLRKSCERSSHGLPPRHSWIGKWIEANGIADYGSLPTREVMPKKRKRDKAKPGEDAPETAAKAKKRKKEKPAPVGLTTKQSRAAAAAAAKTAEDEAFLADLLARKKNIPGGANVSAHGRVTIVTMAKDEGPYILEWVAYHHLLGFTDILVYTNDCTDGTDELLDALAELGLVTRLDNGPWRDKPPQSRALHRASQNPLVIGSDWVLVMDLDEFVSIKTGEGTVDSLIDEILGNGATGMCLTWRFFGSNGLEEFEPEPVVTRLTGAAPEDFSKGYGVKTLYKNDPNLCIAIHRPYLNMRVARSEEGRDYALNWISGSGEPLNGRKMSWKSSRKNVGYGLAQMNHYAVKSREEYLLRRMRGDVLDNHSKYDAKYFGFFDRNEVTDLAARRFEKELRSYMTRLRRYAPVRDACQLIEERRQEKIARLRSAEGYRQSIDELQSLAFHIAKKAKRLG
ncbi:MAG TPA: glycosyltransferase family 2 protein [Paracoccus sp. (in: a-proteobacteria)]|uniref:glycosyltransferase family 2 protein n=1 Tax=Paracoccus sp. TaxID=267 RepID=UPI002C81581B|nr:glycosyltransferase family 2 protein [Paracoccus sp. (in: a-proteobacteria)]HWL58450.1 glycosyltransferase family 2 protein [Paracoccus sp. (in: a-proteobacteria)]